MAVTPKILNIFTRPEPRDSPSIQIDVFEPNRVEPYRNRYPFRLSQTLAICASEFLPFPPEILDTSLNS